MAAARAKARTADFPPSTLLKMLSLTQSQVSDRSYRPLQAVLLKYIFEFQWTTEIKGKHFVLEDFCTMNTKIMSFLGN